jgi:hypothetical protein
VCTLTSRTIHTISVATPYGGTRGASQFSEFLFSLTFTCILLCFIGKYITFLIDSEVEASEVEGVWNILAWRGF